MENSPLQRLNILIGETAIQKLENLKVAVFGVGGVGSWCAEALVRSGVNEMTLVDSDSVALSNVNRQLPALENTVGKLKVDALAERLLQVRSSLVVHKLASRYSAESRSEFDWNHYDVVIDAIDSVNDKVDLLMYASSLGIKVFSSLGAAGKLDPTSVRSASIWKTYACPLGKIVRVKLRENGFAGDFMAVFSEEKNREGYAVPEGKGKTALGSFVGVTATFGMTLASLVVRSVADG